MSNKQSLEKTFAGFMRRISALSAPRRFTFTVEDYSKGGVPWHEWEEPGIYYFVRDGVVEYVGRAIPSTGLKSRVVDQMSRSGDPIWNEVRENPKTEICLIAFDRDDWHWIAALEVLLIDKLRPRFNLRSA